MRTKPTHTFRKREKTLHGGQENQSKVVWMDAYDATDHIVLTPSTDLQDLINMPFGTLYKSILQIPSFKNISQ